MASGGGLSAPPGDNPMDLDARSESAAEEVHATGQAGEVEQQQQPHAAVYVEADVHMTGVIPDKVDGEQSSAVSTLHPSQKPSISGEKRSIGEKELDTATKGAAALALDDGQAAMEGTGASEIEEGDLKGEGQDQELQYFEGGPFTVVSHKKRYEDYSDDYGGGGAGGSGGWMLSKAQAVAEAQAQIDELAERERIPTKKQTQQYKGRWEVFNSNTVEQIDFMTYVDRMELEAKVEKIRANKQRNQELEERAQALVDEEDKQERERKQGQQKKPKEESVAESGMMAVLQMMMAQQAQQTQCMMQGFQGFATMLAGVSGMAGSSSAAAAAAGATTGPSPLPPPTSSKLGGGDIGALPPAQASGVPLGNQGLINRRYNRGFLVRNRRGEGHVIKGSGTVTGHCNASSGLTCLQFRRVSSLHIPSLVQTIVGSRPLLAEAFTKGAIARQVLAGHLPDVHLLATTHNEDTLPTTGADNP